MGEAQETLDILELLIAQGVRPSARDSTEKQLRPLHRAAMTKNFSATKLLLEKDQAMVNLVDAEGRTALYHACLTPNQKLKLVEELVAKGGNFGDKQRPSMPDHDGQIIVNFLNEQNVG